MSVLVCLYSVTLILTFKELQWRFIFTFNFFKNASLNGVDSTTLQNINTSPTTGREVCILMHIIEVSV